MSWEAAFWLILEIALVAWFIRFVRGVDRDTRDWIARVSTMCEPTEGEDEADRDDA